MGCKARKYSDGGKVMEREYGGNPSFAKAVASNFGVGDGYSYGAKKPKAKSAPAKTAPDSLRTTLAKRKKMLDEI